MDERIPHDLPANTENRAGDAITATEKDALREMLQDAELDAEYYNDWDAGEYD